ncbi:MAG: tetratricopeptide repeat protein [Phycisphaerae bacterium]
MNKLYRRRAPIVWTLAVAAVCLLGEPVLAGRGDDSEVNFSNKEFAKLERFEAHALTKADKSFNTDQFRQAASLYEAFILEYGKSKAVPYALMRWGRSLHKDNKRNEAVKQYQEVLDYFPNAVQYAAAALYYKGLAHYQNGDKKLAVKAWAEMAKDKDYSRHFLAAGAINKLADYFREQNQPAVAVKYYEQVAEDFRRSNESASRSAISHVIYHYIRIAPNEPKLREFYKTVNGFDWGPRKIPADLEKDKEYWGRVLRYVREKAHFDENQGELRANYFRYWAEQMDGRFPQWDDYQIALANYKRQYEKDTGKWMQRLDEQFKRTHKEGDYAHVVKWIRLFHEQKPKVMQYYGMLDFSKMKAPTVVELMYVLYNDVQDKAMADNVFGKIKLKELSDSAKENLANGLQRRMPDLVPKVCAAFEDPDYGNWVLLQHYSRQKDLEKALPLADKMALVEEYAAEAIWLKAELLERAKKYDQAIAAYRQSDRAPENAYKIASCYAAKGKLNPAISELRQIENFFKDHRARAALRIAFLYRDFKMKDQYIAALRSVTSKYPDSGESSTAHTKLEEMGVTRIKGGVDAD